MSLRQSGNQALTIRVMAAPWRGFLRMRVLSRLVSRPDQLGSTRSNRRSAVTLSRTTRSGVLALALLLLSSVAPVGAQEASPTASASPTVSLDMLASIPDTLAGLVPEVDIVRGAEHFDVFDLTIDADVAERAGIEAFLEALGAPVEDMTSVSAVAYDDDSFAFLAGLQIAGADQETLMQLYLTALIGSMISPYQELGEIGGKTATLVIDEGELDSAPVYVYGNGDTVWLIAAEEAVVEEVLRQLP
jgi:hypothetical protein